jgi:tRNA-Thr(GGU) m(6)t(6)A37 methyltransferase TsaA
MRDDLELRPIGTVRSPLDDPAVAPRQGDEGAPEAVVVLAAEVLPAAEGIAPGDELIVLTWLHLARRDVLRVHPRDDLTRPERGVFLTRSSDRPNPIGLHRVEVLAVDGERLRVRGLEAVDGTPVVDLKPVLGADPRDR